MNGPRWLRGLVHRPLLGAVAVVTILVGSGAIAYACTSGNSGPPGSVGIVWESYSAPTPSASYVKCTTAITSASLLTIGASGLAPGAYCDFFATLQNTGTLPASLSDSIDPGGLCTADFSYTDNVNTAHPAPTIAAGGTFLYESTISFLPTAANTCQGSSASFGITITGTGIVPPLTAPKISASPTQIISGQSATLTTTSSFGGGASPYTCQWLEEAPGASSYSDLGGSFSCTLGSLPSTSTGTLGATGVWNFELRVTDSEPVTVTSNIVSVMVNPKPVTYSVTFSESGLPSGLTWKVTVNGQALSLCTNGGTDSLTWTGLTSGTYSYSVTGNAGWHQSTLPYSGSVVVSSASVNEPALTYTHVTYEVEFTESGLPSGASWSVSIGGVTLTTSTPTIIFTEANGTYSYTVTTSPSYPRSPSSGTFTVNGAAVSISVKIT